MKDNDNLNKFFKKNLEDYTPDPSWNVPKDDMFLNAIEEVNKDSKPWRKFIWIFLFFGLFAALSTFEIYRLNRINSLQDTIVSLEERIEVLKDKNLNQISNLDEEGVRDLVEVPSTAPSDHVTNNKNLNTAIIDHTSINRKQGSYKKTNYIEAIEEQKIDIIINGVEKSVSPSYIATDLLSSPKTSNQNITSVTHIPNQTLLNIIKVPILGVTLQKPIIYNTIQASPIILDIDKKIISKWFIGLAAINNVSWLSMSNVPAASENALTEYDQTHHCSGIKISTGYQLNSKWSIYGDLGFERYQNQSDLKTDFFYDEAQVNSNDVFETEIQLLNPLGDFSSMASFNIRSSMNQNDVIVEETKIRQKLNVLSLKTGINYTLFESEKFYGEIGLGIGIAAKTNLKNEFDVSLFSENELMTNYKEETDKMKGVNPLFIMGEAKATLGYKLSEHFNISFESAYNRSLTSLRDSAPASGPQTYLHALSIATGVSYNF